MSYNAYDAALGRQFLVFYHQMYFYELDKMIKLAFPGKYFVIEGVDLADGCLAIPWNHHIGAITITEYGDIDMTSDVYVPSVYFTRIDDLQQIP
ncbi:hypothetical protein F-E9_272 [Faustovirus]|nr:hypothetical protein F-E9_272 [Faustovirus]